MFKGNRADVNGGAIFAAGKATYVTFNGNVNFTSNRGGKGGAEYGAIMSLEQNTMITTLNNHAVTLWRSNFP